jgi:hypothetical protein
MQITLVPCERHRWEQFKDFHYQKLPLSPSARCHLAVLEDKGVRTVIGFCAAMTQRGKFDKVGTPTWRAHKTVIRMAESSAMFRLWALVSDAQAQHYVAAGVKFYSQAPIRYAAYRDNPVSNWVRTTKDARRKDSGLRSHEYRWVPTSNDKATQKQGQRSHGFVQVDPSKRAEWCGESINAKDLTGTTFEHKLGSLLVHKLWDMASYDGSCVWLCENLSTGLAELWRSCDLTRIRRRGQRRNKIAYGGYRLPSPGLQGVRWHFTHICDHARNWLAELKLHGAKAADERHSVDLEAMDEELQIILGSQSAKFRWSRNLQ